MRRRQNPGAERPPLNQVSGLRRIVNRWLRFLTNLAFGRNRRIEGVLGEGGMVQLIVFQPITYFSTDPLPITGEALEALFRIGNHQDTARAFAEGRFAQAAGGIETYQLANAKTYAYIANNYTAGEIGDDDATALLHAFMVRGQLPMLALWMVKDNSANTLTAYSRFEDTDGNPHFNSETFTNYFFTADCELQAVHFSKEEFERAIAYYKQFDTVIPKTDVRDKRASGLIRASRVARTLYILQAGRGTADLLVKIAFYCMCLESLFSTDREGITYRIAERTALFIGATGPERRAILEDVTKLYGTRSKVVHGDLVKESQLPDLLERVKCGDAYLRTCLVKILGDPSMLELFSKKPNEAIIEHFKAIVFD